MTQDSTGRGADRQPDEPSETPEKLSVRLVWFVLYWLAGVAVVATIAYAIRAVLL